MIFKSKLKKDDTLAFSENEGEVIMSTIISTSKGRDQISPPPSVRGTGFTNAMRRKTDLSTHSQLNSQIGSIHQVIDNNENANNENDNNKNDKYDLNPVINLQHSQSNSLDFHTVADTHNHGKLRILEPSGNNGFNNHNNRLNSNQFEPNPIINAGINGLGVQHQPPQYFHPNQHHQQADGGLPRRQSDSNEIIEGVENVAVNDTNANHENIEVNDANANHENVEVNDTNANHEKNENSVESEETDGQDNTAMYVESKIHTKTISSDVNRDHASSNNSSDTYSSNKISNNIEQNNVDVHANSISTNGSSKNVITTFKRYVSPPNKPSLPILPGMGSNRSVHSNYSLRNKKIDNDGENNDKKNKNIDAD